jgi:hypothetical protein
MMGEEKEGKERNDWFGDLACRRRFRRGICI